MDFFEGLKNIYRQINEFENSIDGKNLSAGIGYYRSRIYSTFLEPRKGSDSMIVSAHGYLTYDKATKEYRISSSKKLKNIKQGADNYLSVNTQYCTVFGE